MHLNLNAMTTESRNPNTMNLDTMSALEIVTVMIREEAKLRLDRAGGHVRQAIR